MPPASKCTFLTENLDMPHSLILDMAKTVAIRHVHPITGLTEAGKTLMVSWPLLCLLFCASLYLEKIYTFLTFFTENCPRHIFPPSWIPYGKINPISFYFVEIRHSNPAKQIHIYNSKSKIRLFQLLTFTFLIIPSRYY